MPYPISYQDGGKNTEVGSDTPLPSEVKTITAAPLRKGNQAREVITCDVASVDKAGSVVPDGTVYVTIYCPTADVRVAFGEATSDTVGLPVPAGKDAMYAIQRVDGDDGKLHVQCATAGTQVIVAYQGA